MVTEVKQFLDKAGVEALWEKIYNGFAPRWQSYKPSKEGSTAGSNKLPAEFVELKSDKANVGKLHSDESRAALNATFVSAGPISDGAGKWYGRDLVVQIPEVKAPTSATAEDGGYGIMSPEDKWKLDHVGTTAEDAVTIKSVHVGGNELTIKTVNNKPKSVNWDLHYDETNNKLCIRDLNAADNKVVSSVDVDSLLSDAIVKGFLSGVELVDTDADGNAGLYLKFVFTTGIGSDGVSTESEVIFVSVADLVDVYTAGTGISIDQGTFDDAGGDERTSTITLKKATAAERGGIEVIDTANLGDGDSIRNEKVNGRNFGVAILADDDTAYVNVPVTGITIEESTVKDDSIAIATEDSFQILAGYNKTADDVDGWKLTPTYKTISVNKETDVTIDGDTGSNTTTLTWDNRSFDILQTITESDDANGHKITRTASTITLPEETKLSLSSATAATNTISIVSNVNTAKVNNIENVPIATYAGSFSTSAVTDINHHDIINTATTHSFEIQIPAIEESFINSLIYRVD